MPPELRFHHTGIACADLVQMEARYHMLGYKRESPPFVDPIQKIRGVFLLLTGTRIELVTPTDAASPVAGWIRRGVHLYHTAYETDSLSGSILHLRESVGAKVTAAPAPSVAFGGRQIAFMLCRDGMLIELIESIISHEGTRREDDNS